MDFELARAVMVLVPMILSLTVHEYAHARSARALGDDTAFLAGRMTLNPLAHIDPIGTLLLPLFCVLTGSDFFFGWARPVPVNAGRFRRDVTVRKGSVLVSAAGPLSNVALAVLAAIGFFGVLHLDGPEVVQGFLHALLMVNVGLAVFNILPVPPLDGSHILEGALPARYLPYLAFLHRYSFVLFLGLVMFGSPLISPLFRGLYSGIIQVVGGVFGLFLS